MKKKKLSVRPKQLRGDALKARIVEVVRHHVLDAEGTLNTQHVSPSALASLVPCSKTTILKYQDLIDETLADAGLRLARRTGAAKSEALSDKIHLLKQKIATLENEIAALQAHHVSLYDRLLMGSAELGALVRDDAITDSRKRGSCVLCGGKPPDTGGDNVIALGDRDHFKN